MSSSRPVPTMLHPADVAGLRLPWSSLLSREQLAGHVAVYPGLSWWVPGTRSYLIAGRWRHRDDIVEVYESRGEAHREILWNALLRESGRSYGAVVVDPTEYRSAAAFYQTAGITVLDEVLVLRTSALPGPVIPTRLDVEPAGSRKLDRLLQIDDSAFPWLWRNSAEEFQDYLHSPGVLVWLASLDGEPAGYLGATDMGGWAHIDRLAVRRELQGGGLGAELLSWSVGRLHRQGARYIQLTTQGSNVRARSLYQRFGFKQTRGGFKLYGCYLSTELNDGGTVDAAV